MDWNDKVVLCVLLSGLGRAFVWVICASILRLLPLCVLLASCDASRDPAALLIQTAVSRGKQSSGPGFARRCCFGVGMTREHEASADQGRSAVLGAMKVKACGPPLKSK